MARKTIAQLEAEIAELSKPIKTADDQRLDQFWPVVHQAANESSLCSDYDDFIDTLGAPPRPRAGTIRVDFTLEATDQDDAERQVSEIVTAAARAGYEVDSVEAGYWEINY